MVSNRSNGICKGMMCLEGMPTGDNHRPLWKPTTQQIVRELVIGRRLFTRLTGADQGFDIERWVVFLDSMPSLGYVGEYTDPAVWQVWTRDAIARQKSPDFQKYLAMAQEAWNAGLEADVTYESLHNEWLAKIAKLPEGYND